MARTIGTARRLVAALGAISAVVAAGACGSDNAGTVFTEVSLPGPDAAGEPVACPYRAALVAADAVSGSVLWSYCAKAVGGVEALAATTTTVLAAEYDVPPSGGIRLFGLDAATGAQRWEQAVDSFNESYGRDAFYADGNRAGAGVVVYSQLAGGDHVTVGIDMESGQERWRVPAEGTFVTGHGDSAAVAATPGALFETPTEAPQPDLHVVGFDRLTGEARWHRDSGVRDVGAPWGPRTWGNVIVFNQVDPHPRDASPAAWRWDTVALDTATGDQLWRHERGPLALISVGTGTGIGWTPGAAEGDAATLEAFASGSGSTLWRRELAAAQPRVIAAPDSPVVAVGAMHGGAAETTTSTATAAPAPGAALGGVTVYERATGKPRWRVQDAATPAGVTETLVLVTRGQEVIALDVADGATRWRLPFAHPYGVELQAAGGRVFLSSASGMMDPPEEDTAAAPPTSANLVERGSFGLPSGETVRFAASAFGGAEQLCILVDASTTPVLCIPASVPPTQTAGDTVLPSLSAQASLPSGTHAVYGVAWPTGQVLPTAVRGPTGATWPAATSAGGGLLLVIDPQPSTSPSGFLSQPLEALGAAGTVLMRIGPPGGTTVTTGPTGMLSWFERLGACYRSNGADYHAEPNQGQPLASTPSTVLAAEAARQAWEACQGIYYDPAANGPVSDERAAYFACMAGQGWLPPLWAQHTAQWSAASFTCGKDPAAP